MRSDCEQQPTTLDPSPLHGSYGSTRIVSVVVSCVDAPAEEWDHLDLDVLRPSRSGAVCVTCQHFRYEVGKHCVTVLTCPNQQCLIPQGEHLTKRCARWVARREGWCEVSFLKRMTSISASHFFSSVLSVLLECVYRMGGLRNRVPDFI